MLVYFQKQNTPQCNAVLPPPALAFTNKLQVVVVNLFLKRKNDGKIIKKVSKQFVGSDFFNKLF
jgi:hypothetical protein